MTARRHRQSRAPGRAIYALLATVSVVALLATPAAAQDLPPLRGEVDENATSQYLLERDRQMLQNQLYPDSALQPAQPADEVRGVNRTGISENPPGSDENAETAPLDGGDQDAAEAEEEGVPAARTPLDDTATGGVRQPAVETDPGFGRAEAATRQPAVQVRPRTAVADPYAAEGIRAGSFILRPSIEQGLRGTTNADSSATGRSATISETTIRLNAESDWSRHSARVNAYATARRSISGQDLDENLGGLDAGLDLDLGRDLTGIGRFSYEVRPESANSPNIVEGTVSRPLRHIVTGSAGLHKDIGKLRLRLVGDVERDTFEDAELSNGDRISQEDRNSTTLSATLRGGYELSPALIPFAEIQAGRKTYDNRIDSAGYQRSADIFAARAGIAVDLREKLTGELALGWLREKFDDDRLDPVSAFTVDGAINWSPRRGWDVRLSGATRAEAATSAGESGSVLYESRLAVTHELRRNITTTAALGYAWRDYVGSDDHDETFTAEASATWWVNRYAGLTGRLAYETLKSTMEGRDYDATSAFLGITVRR